MINDSPLQCLVGEVVTDAATVHDYAQLAFGTDTGLSIYNDFRVAPEQSRLDDLVGQRVISVASTETEAVIRFEKSSLTVDLRAAAFRGPEAMQLNRTGHRPVIWT